MEQHRHESPVNPLPPVVVALFLVIAGVEVVLSLGARGIIGGPGAVGWRIEAIQTFGISPPILEWMWETRQWPAEHLRRLFTFPFVHSNFTHALFGCVMILALGKMVAEALGPWRLLVIFFLSGIGGAVLFALLVDTSLFLNGAFAGVYGLIGAFTYLLWLRLGHMGESQVRAFTLIGILLLLQLIFGVFFGAGPDWIADIAGFVTGFALTVILVPGFFARLRR